MIGHSKSAIDPAPQDVIKTTRWNRRVSWSKGLEPTCKHQRQQALEEITPPAGCSDPIFHRLIDILRLFGHISRTSRVHLSSYMLNEKEKRAMCERYKAWKGYFNIVPEAKSHFHFVCLPESDFEGPSLPRINPGSKCGSRYSTASVYRQPLSPFHMPIQESGAEVMP
jgi:hypothetical protein